ncbi:late embryogenesis abundant protein At5g17165-like [Durio zibethinus]|uniref:Late embryogenesis abundant protein At5g17165-like n=1 Tax=Durio zibethinus TaxID=66656 RepID=A0A6P5YTR5_DURZI|nr:late embryogenesis abundant protein At5g17165-like [Durio zibethinus]
MAANWKSGGGIASLGKRLLNRTSSPQPTLFNATASPSRPASAYTIRSVHASAYDKNLDDQVHPTVVPDYVIQSQSDKYWAPDPHTGVFGPPSELNTSAGGETQGLRSSLGNGGVNSVLEEKAWFRPTSIEDVEKPHHY